MKLLLRFIILFVNQHISLAYSDFEVYALKNYIGLNLNPCPSVKLCGYYKNDHIMCNQYSGPLWNCSDFELIEMEFDMKLRILSGHNGLRNLEAQRPYYEIPNMNRLFWDDALGEMAKQYVLRCNVYGPPDECHYIGDTNHTIGQNLYYSDVFYGYKKWLTVAVHAWYKYKTRSRVPPHFCRNAKFTVTTQFLWPTSLYIGCAAARVTGGLLFVCYYGPMGNVGIMNETFKRGQVCSECPIGAGCSSVFPALCDNLGGGVGYISNHPNSTLIVFLTCLIMMANVRGKCG